MEIIILSPYNSGSNLMEKIICSTGNKILNDKYSIFKHCIHKNVLKQKIDKYPKLNIIIIYRDIFQWINSCKKYKYHISQVKDINREIRFGCECVKPHTINKLKNRFNNILELHNTYYNNYKYLIENCSNNFLVVNYDDIIKPIDNILYIYSLLKELRLPVKENIEKILCRPSKIHGKSVKSYIEAYIKTKKVKDHFKKSDIKLIEDNSNAYDIIEDKLYKVKIQQEYII